MQTTVFISGASSGFGRGCAVRFAQRQWRLVLAARRMDRLNALKAELGGSSAVHVIQLDVRDKLAVAAAVDDLPQEFSQIDVLINNAGLALGLEPAHEAQLEDWETMVDTNIKGMLYCTRKILPQMVSRKQGHIVNMGSVAGDYPYPGGNTYGGTKAFVKQFSLNLRADLQGTGVRVTNIEPGLAQTEFSMVRFHGQIDKADRVYSGTHPLTADDIARIVLWAVEQPQHVNINRVEVMPVCQAFGPMAIHREQ